MYKSTQFEVKVVMKKIIFIKIQKVQKESDYISERKRKKIYQKKEEKINGEIYLGPDVLFSSYHSMGSVWVAWLTLKLGGSWLRPSANILV